MQVGIGLPNTNPGADRDLIINWAKQADAGPFSSLSVLDRLLYDSYEPLTVLAAAAVVTQRIHLATTIVISPLRNTAVLAKEAATVHALSGGRLTLGLAVGARQDDYETARVDPHLRGRRFTEQLADLRSYWEDEAFGPAAVRPGGPKLLIGGTSDQTFARMARYADGYVHNGGPPKVFARAAEKARTAWLDAGRPGQPQVWGMGYFALGEAETLETGAAYLRDYYAFTGPFAEKIAAGLLTSPQTITQFIRGYADAGCDELALFPAVPDLAQLHRLSEVIG